MLNGNPSALSKATSSALNNQTAVANEQVRQGELSTKTALDNMQKMGDAERITSTASAIKSIHGMAQDLANQGAKQSKEKASKWTGM